MDGNSKSENSKKTSSMRIVELDKLPKLEDIEETPTEDLVLLYKVCCDMRELCEKENGIGLSAVQVGLPWKLFVMKIMSESSFGKVGDYVYLVNCEYEGDTEKVQSIEGCLSIKDKDKMRHFKVERFTEIQLNGYQLIDTPELSLKKIENQLISLQEQSIVIQHEVDHHRAVLISDIGEEIFLWR